MKVCGDAELPLLVGGTCAGISSASGTGAGANASVASFVARRPAPIDDPSPPSLRIAAAKCGKEAESEVFEVAGFAELERNFLAGPIAHAGLHEAERGWRCDGFFVAAGVVAVGVGDESERLREARIEPQIRLRQIERPVVPDLDHGVSERVL